MGRYLEEGDFAGFWKEYDLNKSLFQECKNFELSIRKHICLVVSWTYSSLKASFLCDLLQIREQDLQPLLQQLNLQWTVKGDRVMVPKDTTEKAKKQLQTISTDQMNNILGTLF